MLLPVPRAPSPRAFSCSWPFALHHVRTLHNRPRYNLQQNKLAARSIASASPLDAFAAHQAHHRLASFAGPVVVRLVTPLNGFLHVQPRSAGATVGLVCKGARQAAPAWMGKPHTLLTDSVARSDRIQPATQRPQCTQAPQEHMLWESPLCAEATSLG